MTPERRRCVCAGWIEADNTPEAITVAVQEHQREPEHREYVDEALADAYTFPVPDRRIAVRRVA